MGHITSRRTAALLLSGLLGVVAGRDAIADVGITPVGSPGFVIADTHLFAAPIGTAATGYDEFLQTLQAVLPPPGHALNPTLGIGPGTPHAGPYDHEIGDGVVAAGFVESTTFTTDQYSNGTGVFLAFMVLPGAGSPTGSSPDFSAGPILPHTLFPLTISGLTFTNGVVNAVLGEFQVPAIDQVPGFEGLDGHSHIPFFFGDNFDFAFQQVTGDYEYRISLLDAAGNGYDITAAFQLQPVPEPATWALAALGGFVVGALAWRRRSGAAGSLA
jgi:hypothetical protein